MAPMIRNTLAALGFMALGATSMLALDASASGPGGHGTQPFPGAGLARAMGQLDLTDAQEQALDALKDEVRSEMLAGRAERLERKGDALDQLLAGEIDRAELHKQIDAEAARRTALAHRMTDRVLDLHDSLSPQQKADLAELIAEHQERREQMQGEGQRGGRGDSRHR